MEHESLPAAVWERVAPHFEEKIDAPLRARMQETAAMNSRAPIARPRLEALRSRFR